MSLGNLEWVIRKRFLARCADVGVVDFLEEADSQWSYHEVLTQAIQIDLETWNSNHKPYASVKKQLKRIGVTNPRITGIYALVAAQLSNLHSEITKKEGLDMPQIQVRSLLRAIRTFPLRDMLGQTVQESRRQLAHYVGDYLGNLYYQTMNDGTKNDPNDPCNVGLMFYTAAATLSFVDFRARMVPEPLPLFLRVLANPPESYPDIISAGRQLTDLLHKVGTPEFSDSIKDYLGIRIEQ